MFVNYTHKVVRTVLDSMNESDIPFYLTGSRFFGNSEPNSDWDFFVGSSPSVIGWLKTNNFVERSSAYTGDMFSTTAFRHSRELVDVQVIAWDLLSWKIRSQEAILTIGWSYPQLFQLLRNKTYARDAWFIASKLTAAS